MANDAKEYGEIWRYAWIVVLSALTAAFDLRNGVHAGNTGASPDTITAMTIPMLFDYMGVRLNGPRA